MFLTIIEIDRDEAAILRHRLNVPDAMCDALGDLPEDAVEQAIERVDRMVSAGHLDPNMGAEERAVLLEAAEGSTFLATLHEQASRAKLRRWNRAADRLEDHIASIAGHAVAVPRR